MLTLAAEPGSRRSPGEVFLGRWNPAPVGVRVEFTLAAEPGSRRSLGGVYLGGGTRLP